jgi:hypothetical protein
MKTKLLLLSVFFLSVSFYSVPHVTSSLKGSWELADRTTTKGAEIIFKDDNKLLFLTTLIADYDYSYGKNRIVYSFTNPITHKFFLDTMNVIIKKDKIFRIKNKKDTIIMLRIHSGSGKNEWIKNKPLLGKWLWRYPTGDTATTEFTENKMLFRMATEKNYGKYKIVGNEISISIPKIIDNKFKFCFQKKILVINGFPKEGDNLFIKVN